MVLCFPFQLERTLMDFLPQFYKRKFGDGNYTIYVRKKEITPDEPAPYDLVNKSSFVVFTNSTLEVLPLCVV